MSIVLQNRACESDATTPCSYNRTFTPQTDEVFVSAATNATLAVFFDISENVRMTGTIEKTKFYFDHLGIS